MSEKKNLLLIGGGHAHIEVLRQLAEKPIPDVDVALFDSTPSVWYSGMIPGVVAGHYEPADAKVNLWALCQRARVRFIETSIVGVDPAMQRVYTASQDRHFYDVASFDIGSISKPLNTSPGAYVVPVKPTDRLLDAIREREAIKSSSVSTIQVIGGGAAAVEIALALAHRWKSGSERKIGLVSGARLLSGFPARARKAALAACKRAGVAVVEADPVASIEPTHLALASGANVPCQISVLATGSAPPELLSHMDVLKADDGCIAINSGLQSRSHKNVFAAGDCATNPKALLPKAGVYAVRQGPILFENLGRALRGGELIAYDFKPEALALISLGEKRAIASRNGLSIAGDWVWRWKDRIDREWLAKYR